MSAKQQLMQQYKQRKNIGLHGMLDNDTQYAV